MNILTILPHRDGKKQFCSELFLIYVAEEMKIEYSKCRIKTAQQKIIIIRGDFLLWE
jgi:hypothetical protein